MTDEKQKKTTDQYRNNWDAIFGKVKTPEERMREINENFEKEYIKLNKIEL